LQQESNIQGWNSGLWFYAKMMGVELVLLFTAEDLFASLVCLLAPLWCSGTSRRLSSLTVSTAMAEVNDELGLLELLRPFVFLWGFLPVVSQLEFQMRFVVEEVVAVANEVPWMLPPTKKSLEPWFSNRFWWVTDVGDLSEVFEAVQEST